MTQPPALDWSARLALVVAGEVRRHRLAQGLSAQQLAERCAAIGMPIQRSVLANLESGRRTTVNVSELLVLAHALAVPPGVLLFPAGREVQSEVLPGGYAEPGFAVDWLSGHAFLNPEAAEDFYETPLGMIRLHQESATSLRRTIRQRDHARQEYAELLARYGDAEARADAAEAQVNQISQQMQELHRPENKVNGALDFERYQELSARHDAASQEAQRENERGRQLYYARQRVTGLERSVESLEARLRDLRERMKERQLQPPLLPHALSYLDPERPALEDVPIKDADTSSRESGLPGGISELEASVTAGGEFADDAPPLLTPDQQDEARGILEEMKPYITEIMTKAVEEAMRRRQQKDDG